MVQFYGAIILHHFMAPFYGTCVLGFTTVLRYRAACDRYVRLSDTWQCVKTTQARIRKSSSIDSTKSLFVACKANLKIRLGSHWVRALNYSGVRRIGVCRPVSCSISETMQHRTKVTNRTLHERFQLASKSANSYYHERTLRTLLQLHNGWVHVSIRKEINTIVNRHFFLE